MIRPQDYIKKMDFFFLSSFCVMIEKYSVVRGPSVDFVVRPSILEWGEVKSMISVQYLHVRVLKKPIASQLK